MHGYRGRWRQADPELTRRIKQQIAAGTSLFCVESNPSQAPAVQLAPRLGVSSRTRGRDETDAEDAVTGLYHAHALGLTRLAHVMLGARPVAQDVFQDAFYGLYRHWDRLADKQKALQYLRSSVLNGCRSELRRGRRPVTGTRSACCAESTRRCSPSPPRLSSPPPGSTAAW
jgi:hypothetical protein